MSFTDFIRIVRGNSQGLEKTDVLRVMLRRATGFLSGCVERFLID